jgi:hypothetical protein
MAYPITEEHKMAAVNNLNRLAPQLETRLVQLGSEEAPAWQLEVTRPEGKSQYFDAFLVGENFLKRPWFADEMMLDELVSYGILILRYEKGKKIYE